MYYGIGFPLFFQFLQGCMIFMTFGAVCYMIPTLVIHEKGSSCIDPYSQPYLNLTTSCATNIDETP
jgi:hypothetical protein